MPCYHPLKAFPVGFTDSGKVKYKICSYGVDHVEFVDGSVHCLSEHPVVFCADKVVRDYIEIPCGKCIGCRLAYSRAWADRCMLELGDHESSYFLTLTYDDEHLKECCSSGYLDESTGEWFDTYSLRKKDLQDFHKNLRYKLFGSSAGNIRYFACGEYGDHTYRPHYHDIVFGLKLDDLKFYKRSEGGYNYYNSEFLSNIWKKGFVVVGKVNWDTCAYTARYVMKKLKGEEGSFYEEHGLEAPFVVMSRKPGIARKYYDDHPELFDSPCVYISTEDGAHPVYPSKYYKRLFDLDSPEESAIMKEKNKEIALLRHDNKVKQSQLSYLDQLSVDEMALEGKLKSLQRKEF